MPFPMRIQPIDYGEPVVRNDAVKPLVLKSRLKRLFDRPFNGGMRISSADKPVTGAGAVAVAAGAEFEPSSVCLDKMVRIFMEENNEKQLPSAAVAGKLGRNRCNCFNGNSNDSSDDEFDFFSDSSVVNSSFSDPFDSLKSLVPCTTVAERNLLADTSRIVEKNRSCQRKDELRRIVTDCLIALDYYASVCKSKWEKSSSIPAGEYEYVDVIIEGERILIDLDFRSEFEIARSTSGYKAVLLSLPCIFVGKSDRLLQIVSLASEAARQSLKKKGMHVAPWRKAEYMKSKWLSPHTRLTAQKSSILPETAVTTKPEPENTEVPEVLDGEIGELNLIFGEKTPSCDEPQAEATVSPAEAPPQVLWQLPAVKPKSLGKGNKVVVTGLASLLKEKY